MNIQIIKEAMESLIAQRTSLDHERGTDNERIAAAQAELDKLERLFAVSDMGLAEILYTSYCEAVGGVAHDNKPLPSWREFSTDPKKKKQVFGWIAAARILRTAHRTTGG